MAQEDIKRDSKATLRVDSVSHYRSFLHGFLLFNSLVSTGNRKVSFIKNPSRKLSAFN